MKEIKEMKRLIMIGLVIAMVAILSVSAFATAGGFISSPSGNPAPELVNGENESEECVSELIITAYGDRDELNEEARQEIEAAYSEIIGAKDLSDLNSAIKEVAKKYGVDPSTLAVSDLFDISATNCDGHGDHGHFDITLKSDTLKNFVCLLHFYDDEWHIVENAEVTNNGEHLEFDEDQLSPFAIVVSTEDITVNPETPKNYAWVIAPITAAAVGTGIGLYFFFKNKKKPV